MYFVLYRMYFDKNTVSKHKNASIKIIKCFILRFVICILYNKWMMIIQNTQTVGLRKDNSILRTHNQVPE